MRPIDLEELDAVVGGRDVRATLREARARAGRTSDCSDHFKAWGDALTEANAARSGDLGRSLMLDVQAYQFQLAAKVCLEENKIMVPPSMQPNFFGTR